MPKRQYVIKDGFVYATHTMEQDLTGLYPDAEIIERDGEILLPYDGNGNRVPDPRLAG